jgi:hypothetical protein
VAIIDLPLDASDDLLGEWLPIPVIDGERQHVDFPFLPRGIGPVA